MVSGDRVAEAAESVGVLDVVDLGKTEFCALEEGRVVDIS